MISLWPGVSGLPCCSVITAAQPAARKGLCRGSPCLPTPWNCPSCSRFGPLPGAAASVPGGGSGLSAHVCGPRYLGKADHLGWCWLYAAMPLPYLPAGVPGPAAGKAPPGLVAHLGDRHRRFRDGLAQAHWPVSPRPPGGKPGAGILARTAHCPGAVCRGMPPRWCCCGSAGGGCSAAGRTRRPTTAPGTRPWYGCGGCTGTGSGGLRAWAGMNFCIGMFPTSARLPAGGCLLRQRCCWGAASAWSCRCGASRRLPPGAEVIADEGTTLGCWGCLTITPRPPDDGGQAPGVGTT